MAKRETRASQKVQYPTSPRQRAAGRGTAPRRPGNALSPSENADRIKLARARFQQAEDADKDQRRRELEDLRFYSGDQWPADIVTSRQGSPAIGTTPAIPARPTITINKVREPVKQVLNSIRQSDLGIALAAADDFGELGIEIDKTEIELREGLIRRIQRSSEAEDAYFWAAMRAVICGRGYFGINVRYVTGKSMDREAYVERYYNQATVSLDPFHEQPDGSDADWGFVGTDLSWDRYCADYPWRIDKDGTRRKNTLIACNDDEWRALGDVAPNWFTTKKDADTKEDVRGVRVMNYYYTELVSRELVQLSDGSVYWFDEPMPTGAVVIARRSVTEKQIKWCQIDGYDILDETDWEGKYIPIVKVMGEELQPYDNERRAQGMVRPGRGAQEGFNAMTSKWVEVVAYSPIPPWQADPEAIEGFEEQYALANQKPMPYLPYNQYDDQGRELKIPSRTPLDTGVTAISGATMLFDQAIKSTMGTGDPELGNVAPSIKSGKALSALIGQSQLGKSDYLDNTKRSMRYAGLIINDLLYPTYGKRPGRLLRMVNGQNETETVTISPPIAPPDPNVPAPIQLGPQTQAPSKEYRLTPDANFNVLVKIVPNSDSRRTEEAELLGHVIETQQGAMGVIGDLFFKSLDGPGHDEMAERFRLMLAPPIQQYLAQKAQGLNLPPHIAQEMSQDKAHIQQLTQLVEQAKQEIQNKTAEKQLELQGKEQVARMQEIFESARNRENNEVKLAVAELSAKVERMALFAEERDRLGLQIHEHQQSDLEHQRDMVQQTQQQGADAALSGQEHQQTMTQQAQAAELAPEPAQPQAGA